MTGMLTAFLILVNCFEVGFRFQREVAALRDNSEVASAEISVAVGQVMVQFQAFVDDLFLKQRVHDHWRQSRHLPVA